MVTSVTDVYEESGGRAAPVLADRYRLITQLGRGGTARVLKAWDERLDREVAVKIFQPHADPVGRLRFEDEARMLAGFDHPRLVKVFDSGVANGEPFLVLELIKGPHLGRRIDLGPMTPDEVCRIGVGVAEALAYVHSKGVVHRDVKPGNVLLSADGLPHLADFGLAKLLARSGITASDRLVGTAAYLSPEQVLGTEVGPPADVYGLGLVLLECLTSEIEYPGLDAETVIARLSRRPRIPEDIPVPLAETLERMTRSVPAERPSANECAELLLAERLTVPLPRPRRFITPKVAIILGAGLTAGAAALFVVTPPPDDSRETPVHVQPDRGTPLDSTITNGSPVPGQQPVDQAGNQQPQRQANRQHGGGETIAKTPELPSSAPPTEDPAAEQDPLEAQDEPSRSKKPKNSRTKDPKSPKNSS